MKNLFVFSLLLLSTNAFSEGVETTYNCTPTTGLKKVVNVAGDQLVKINGLKGTLGSHGNPEFSMDAEIHSEMQIANNFNHEKLPTEKITENYAMNEMRSGMILDLKDKEEGGNSLKFAYKIMHLGDMEVTTAGPIPEGTWNQKVNLILISDYSAEVLKVDFACKVTVKYDK